LCHGVIPFKVKNEKTQERNLESGVHPSFLSELKKSFRSDREGSQSYFIGIYT
jgi:hypothetical protein